MDIHVCDTSSTEGKIALNNLTRLKKKNLITFSAPMSNGVGVMVSKIIAMASNSPTGLVKNLSIWAHGGPGSQGVSRGAESAQNEHWAGIDLRTLATNKDMRDLLSRLWEVLDWNGRVELRGCKVGAGVEGQKFLNVLTVLWEVPVYAGEVDQLLTSAPGLELAWAGTVHVATPGSSGTSTFKGEIQY
jgi:hypothetical protein